MDNHNSNRSGLNIITPIYNYDYYYWLFLNTIQYCIEIFTDINVIKYLHLYRHNSALIYVNYK